MWAPNGKGKLISREPKGGYISQQMEAVVPWPIVYSLPLRCNESDASK